MSVRGLLIDLDGTVYQAGSLIAGAPEAIAWLRREGVPFLFTTNTSRKSRRAVVDSLAALGLEAAEHEILTAPVAAARWLSEREVRRVQLLLPASTHRDFAAFRAADDRPEAVVVGDMGTRFDFATLNAAFHSLLEGARLVAIHKNRYWITREGPTLDAGPFVAALEYAARVEAVLVGKPAPAFFELAAHILGVAMPGLVVVGDDPESDVRGGRAAGLRVVQVATGKYDAERAAAAPPEERPQRTIDSLADLPAALDRLGDSE